jgi:hypothetical protein
VFCIYADEPCNDVRAFCKDLFGACRYAVYEQTKHMCCPTCTMDTGAAYSALPSPLLRSPSPLPPLPQRPTAIPDAPYSLDMPYSPYSPGAPDSPDEPDSPDVVPPSDRTDDDSTPELSVKNIVCTCKCA